MINTAKIIPFPGVSLEPSDSFQDKLDRFIEEMGYVNKTPLPRTDCPKKGPGTRRDKFEVFDVKTKK